LVQWPLSVRSSIINRFFTFDDVVVRELLGKKLSSKLRKDLDDVNEKCKVEISSCRRQFDNLKEVIKRVTKTLQRTVKEQQLEQQQQEQGNNNTLIQTIIKHFFLEEELARYVHTCGSIDEFHVTNQVKYSKYSTTVFFAFHKFELAKRSKVRDLLFSDCYHMSLMMMQYWTVQSSSKPLYVQLDFAALREIKNIFLSDKEKKFDDFRDLLSFKLKEFASSQAMPSNAPAEQWQADQANANSTSQGNNNTPPMSPADSPWHTLTPAHCSMLNERFPPLFRNLLLIGASLQQNLKDVFLDLQEKFVDVWASKIRLHHFYSDLIFAKAIECCASFLDANKCDVATRFLSVVRDCIRIMLNRTR